MKDSQDTPTYSIGSYLFDSKNQLLQHEEKHFQLTPRENELLLFLIKNKNTLCSHTDIRDHLWGKNDYFNRKSLNVFISHLRKYLKHDSSISISNFHKKGFVLNVPEE